jgi:phosphatidylethanolamine-binding protein (PEBP) family uncharacterized protein
MEFRMNVVVNNTAKAKTGGIQMKKLTLSTAMLALLGTGAFAADPFTLISSSFKDGTMMDVKHAGNIKTNPNCVGQNVSPELKWTNPPAVAKSFVVDGLCRR